VSGREGGREGLSQLVARKYRGINFAGFHSCGLLGIDTVVLLLELDANVSEKYSASIIRVDNADGDSRLH
jgi:hypothetical protein